jgi:hypothetical protein
MINGCIEGYKIHYSRETGIKIHDIINDGAGCRRAGFFCKVIDDSHNYAGLLIK